MCAVIDLPIFMYTNKHYIHQRDTRSGVKVRARHFQTVKSEDLREQGARCASSDFALSAARQVTVCGNVRAIYFLLSGPTDTNSVAYLCTQSAWRPGVEVTARHSEISCVIVKSDVYMV